MRSIPTGSRSRRRADRARRDVLPELLDSTGACDGYDDAIARLAARTGCVVVGGTRYVAGPDGRRANRGVVSGPDGVRRASYTKLFPYGEDFSDVTPGTSVTTFRLGSWRIGVAVCADLWRPGVATALGGVDLVAVPSFSISVRKTPGTPRSLWHSLAAVRAYELGAYVGISDWAHPSRYGDRTACGVSCLAVPFSDEPDPVVSGLAAGAAERALALEPLRAFRRRREALGFRGR